MKAVLSAVVAFCAGIVFAAESPVLRLAVLSDLQGYPYPEDSGMRNLERALDVLAPFKPDVVLTVGDINDGGCDVDAVRYYKGRCDARLGVVPHVACLGNHEIGFVPKELQAERTPALCIADFNAVFGAGPSRLVHKVIGGYDFIAISIRRTSGFLPDDMPLLKGALDKAVARDAKKPVFVLTHYHPYDTVNGSDSKEADGGLRALLDGYPQVVNLSGHTHNPLQDPRSIWQGTFTVLETSTLCYGCLDEHPPMSNQISCLIPYGHESIGCLLLEVFADRLVVRRFAVREGRELEPDRPWSFALPYDPKKPTYDFASRAAAAPTPRFPQAVEPTLWYDFGFVYILFNSVENKDDTYAYRIELTESGGEMKSYWHLSDFYRAPSLRVPRICSRILPNTVRAGGSYHCRIVPVGSLTDNKEESEGKERFMSGLTAVSRRDFIGGAAGFAATGLATGCVGAGAKAPTFAGNMAWGLLLQLGGNMWGGGGMVDWSQAPRSREEERRMHPDHKLNQCRGNDVIVR